MINNSALIRLIRIIRGSIRATNIRVAYGSVSSSLRQYGHYPKIDPPQYRRQLSDYGARAKRLSDLSFERGALPVFISQRRGDAFLRGDALFATDRKAVRFRQVQNLYNQELLRICRLSKAVCIDLASKIELSEADFFDRIHTTPAGSDKIAAFSFERLDGAVRAQLLDWKTNSNPGTTKR